MTPGMLQTLYRSLTEIGGPLIRHYLDRRRAQGREDPLRQGERLGIPSLARPDGRLIWFHAASIGEANSILVLVQGLLGHDPDAHVLVTTGTVTSAQVMARRLPARAFHQYFPVDRPAYVRRFLDHWHPDLVIWTESEIWPNMLWEVRERRLPAALVNARMSQPSFRRWLRVPGFIGPLLSAFRVCLAQTEEDADRLIRLGASSVEALGNLKFAADPPAADPSALGAMEKVCNGRPMWFFASSHPGEDEIAAAVHQALVARVPDLLTLVAPRHPHRGDAIVGMLRGRGLTVARRSVGEMPEEDVSVYVADTVGEMGIFFRLAPVVCVGGSLVPHGGQNPIEPAQLGCAVLYGPHMENFSAVVAELEAAGAALPVADGPALAGAAGHLLTDPAARDRLGQAAARMTARKRAVADKALDRLVPLLVKSNGAMPL